MFVLTLFLAIAACFLFEVLGRTWLSKHWSAMRWSSLPSTGAAMGTLHPMGLLPGIEFDLWVSFALGVGIGAVIAIAGVFHEGFWGGPDEAKVASTGRRSAILSRRHGY